jgi:Transposase IS66 family
VFANLTTVAYVYAESRESGILEDLLDGFSGVLVSDFYAAYDSVPCAQQKCLIHLMRDINEDLHKNPFDEELKEIAGRFGSLLHEIVERRQGLRLKRELKRTWTDCSHSSIMTVCPGTTIMPNTLCELLRVCGT